MGVECRGILCRCNHGGNSKGNGQASAAPNEPSTDRGGVKYRLVNPQEDDWWPQLAVDPVVIAPPGNPKRGLEVGLFTLFCRYGCKRILPNRRRTAAVDTDQIQVRINRDYWFVGWQLQRTDYRQFNP
jgi:hypothetical protein